MSWHGDSANVNVIQDMEITKVSLVAISEDNKFFSIESPQD